jgi:hypothetical protein
MKWMKNCRMMSRSLLIIVFFLFVTSLNSQSFSREGGGEGVKNTAYFSFGGPAIYYSLNYERHLVVKEKYSLGLKAGFGTNFSPVAFPDEFSIPLGVYFLYGKKKGHLDVSFNITNYFLQQYDYDSGAYSKELHLLYVPSIAYRFQKPEGGLMFRAGLSSIININPVTDSFVPWIDISVGWAF